MTYFKPAKIRRHLIEIKLSYCWSFGVLWISTRIILLWHIKEQRKED